MTRLLFAALCVVLLAAVLSVVRHPHTLAAASSPRVAASRPAQSVTLLSTVVTPRHRAERLRRTTTLHWDALAQCESSGHWDDNTGNGYYGGVQMDGDFWATYGGLQYASRPDLATRAQQIRVALNGYRVRGRQPWPVCGVRL